MPFPTPQCSSYRKGSLQVTLNYGRQLYLLTISTQFISIWPIGRTLFGELCKQNVLFSSLSVSAFMSLLMIWTLCLGMSQAREDSPLFHKNIFPENCLRSKLGNNDKNIYDIKKYIKSLLYIFLYTHTHTHTYTHTHTHIYIYIYIYIYIKPAQQGL